jgi:hypothetical protein
MSKNNTIALTEKHNAPEHHRIKAQQLYHSFHAQPGHSYCTKCGAIGFNKRWYIDPAQEHVLRRNKNANAVLCPGCLRLEQQLFEGEVVLTNSRCLTLMGEIVALIKHTEGKSWHNNPGARIAVIIDDQDFFHIQTTTRSLAERIGKDLQSAFKGKLEVKRTKGERFARVYWSD